MGTVNGTHIPCPRRAYATMSTPQPMRYQTDWPIPSPEVMCQALKTPLRGMWIDHVPSGAEIAAMNLRCVREPERAWRNPLVTGGWDDYRYVWMAGHPETMSPQMVMDDEWFDHRAAREPPPPIDGYRPESGRTVGTSVGLSMSGSGNKHAAPGLPALWRRGLLRTAEERGLSNELIRNAPLAPDTVWYQLVLDEGWTVRRAAQVLREAGVSTGPICAWTNRWARKPEGAPPRGNAPVEEPLKVQARCRGQGSDRGRWPLSRTEEIAGSANYRRVE